MKSKSFFKKALALLLLAVMLFSFAACGDGETPAPDDGNTPAPAPQATEYDFYITLGTMPTLYATLNAYARQNPNTYMWFSRGNTISRDFTAKFINYFEIQSIDNSNSAVCWSVIRDRIRHIKEADPTAKFNLYCDDLRVNFIPQLFEYAGIKFEDLKVYLLSDGTGTYANYAKITDEAYNGFADSWNDILKHYRDGQGKPDFTPMYSDLDDWMGSLQDYAFYISTFDNVEYWVQNPEYLTTSSSAMSTARGDMNIVKKNPAEMYKNLPDAIRKDYQKAVLANALVNSDTLETLDDAVEYFDSQLANRDKEAILILGSSDNTLNGDGGTKLGNKTFVDQTIEFYTPTLDGSDNTKVHYKGKEYAITAGDTTVTVDGKNLKIGETAVYLFFKGHPAHPANEELMQYFEDNGIEVLPHRTPVEVLFWMYDVKVGGYQSTSLLSCYKGQTEFFYGAPTTEAIVQMQNSGFFDGVAIFER